MPVSLRVTARSSKAGAAGVAANELVNFNINPNWTVLAFSWEAGLNQQPPITLICSPKHIAASIVESANLASELEFRNYKTVNLSQRRVGTHLQRVRGSHVSSASRGPSRRAELCYARSSCSLSRSSESAS
jgi:hypothetical protein